MELISSAGKKDDGKMNILLTGDGGDVHYEGECYDYGFSAHDPNWLYILPDKDEESRSADIIWLEGISKIQVREK